MTDQCPASPMGVRDDTAVMQSVKRPPMVKAHTIQSPSDLQYYSPAIQTDSHQGYGYPNQPNQPLFQSQGRAYQIRPNYSNYPPTQSNSPMKQRGQSETHQGYPIDPQEQTAPYYQGVNKGRALPEPPHEAVGTKIPQSITGAPRNLPNPMRRPGDIVPVPVPVSPTHRPSFARGAQSFNEETHMPVVKMQSPLNISTESRVKVVLVWSKERPTLEREITFFDSTSQDPLTLVWSEEKLIYQGNGSLNIGQHSGSLVFPTTGEMLAVQQFEVIWKPMGLGMIKLKLYEPYQPGESVKTETIGVGDANNGKLKEEVTKLGLQMKEKDNKIEEMRWEIEELTEANNTVKSEKQRCKQDMVKQDEQLIETLVELSRIRTFGRDIEGKLCEDIDRLKLELEKSRDLWRQNLESQQQSEVSGNPSQDLLQLNENIRNLEEKIRNLEEKEGELTELKGTFKIMSKESNNLTVEIEGMKTKLLADEIQIHDLTDSIREYKRRDEELNNELTQLKHSDSVAMEGQVDSLKAEIFKLENSNKQLSENFDRLEIERNTEIEELTEIQAKQQQTIDNNNKHHLSRLQEKDESTKILANELETIKADLENERDEILRGKELEISQLRQEFEGKETELRNEVTQQMEELEHLHTQSSKNEENSQIIEVVTSEKSKLEERIEELKEENKKITLELTENPEKVKLIAELDNANDQIVKIKQINLANQEQLKIQINKLENENTQLKDDARILSAKIEEQNLQLIEAKQSQQNNEKTQILIETKEKQISDLKMQILDQQAKDQTYQTQVEKQTKELNEELEQLKSDYTDLKDLLKSENKNEKFLALETEKHSLNEQIDVLHGKIETLTESKKENEQSIKELESSFEKLTTESKALEIQLEESKNEFNKLQEKGEEYYQNSQQQIDVLKTELETAMNELKSERENSGISKQLIAKLNSDILKLPEADSGPKIADLERQLFETERTRTETEQKLGDMATEIANRDSKIQILNQDIAILQNKGQVAQATPTPVMPSNPSKQKEDKKLVQKLSKESKHKHTDTSGATPGATLSELTPQIIPVANRSGKSSTKIAFRPSMSVNTVKLKSLPNPADYQGKQVIYLMNKRYELGILMVLFEAPTKLGLRSVTGKYAGIKLHNPVGNCNGEFRTKRLFECEQNYGIFVAYEDVLVPVV